MKQSVALEIAIQWSQYMVDYEDLSDDVKAETIEALASLDKLLANLREDEEIEERISATPPGESPFGATETKSD